MILYYLFSYIIMLIYFISSLSKVDFLKKVH